MITETRQEASPLYVSDMAETLIGSEIIRIAGEVNEKIKKGARIHNLTIGDFDPSIFPIPPELNRAIVEAYRDNHTNYPAANGIGELRAAVSAFLRQREGLNYTADEILISAGARPLIYGIYRTLLNTGDTVVFPVPSWNNNHYCHLTGAKPVLVETRPENNFMPAAEEIAPHLREASLLSLCSPLNPTGTVFSEKVLGEICDLVIEENRRRGPGQKPLYLLYDQIYWILTFGSTKHYNPVSLRPEMRNYTIFVDGLSKAFAATGVRVGWAFGPAGIIEKMKSILSHIGAWAPKAEQVACAGYLVQHKEIDGFLTVFREKVAARLNAFHKGFSALQKEGFRVNVIAPQAALYLTVQFNLAGMKTPGGKILQSTKDITSYLLAEAGMAVVPFYAFGSSEDSNWYRISVGTCSMDEIGESLAKLKTALSKLS